MTIDRFDALLARALATGLIPEEATEAERAQLEPLLRTGAILEQAGARTNREASASMPIARARFERFLVAETQKATPSPSAATPRAGFFSRIAHANRGLLLAGGAVAIGVVAVLAVFGSQAFLSGTQTADAQVLVPDDFVQVQGIVTAVANPGAAETLTLQSEFGKVTVALSESTSIVEDGSGAAPGSIAVGDTVVVGGVVGSGSDVAAQTIAITAMQAKPPRQSKALQLTKLLPNLQGRILVLAVASDGQSAHVLLEAANGTRYYFAVQPEAAARLLTASATALGARVSVTNGVNPNDSIFDLDLEPAASSTPAPGASEASSCPRVSAAQPAFAGVCGVVLSRQGNVLDVVDSSHVVHKVVIRPSTRILLGESGLTARAIRAGDSVIGHAIVVSGGLEGSTGRVVADLVVVGKKL